MFPVLLQNFPHYPPTSPVRLPIRRRAPEPETPPLPRRLLTDVELLCQHLAMPAQLVQRRPLLVLHLPGVGRLQHLGLAVRGGLHLGQQDVVAVCRHSDPGYMRRQIQSLERRNTIHETNLSFDSCKSCKRLGTSRLHDLHESKLPFVLRTEFISSKLSNLSVHVSGVSEAH